MFYNVIFNKIKINTEREDTTYSSLAINPRNPLPASKPASGCGCVAGLCTADVGAAENPSICLAFSEVAH